MLDELKNTSMADLVDLLSKYTTTYTRLLTLGDRSGQYATAREMIKLIQGEIQMRKSREGSHFHMDHSPSRDPGNQANA